MKHITVLLMEAVTGLALEPDHVVVDATLGAAGHARAIVGRLGAKAAFIGIDADESALKAASDLASLTKAKVHLVHDNFSHLNQILKDRGIERVDSVLADLGWHTDQFTDGGRGFSFLDTEALTMTYGPVGNYAFVASDIVNDWTESEIANVIFGYGEERHARKIAKAICDYRVKQRIKSGAELAGIVESAVPMFYRRGKTHPATKTFQALRIAVNDEFTVLEGFIADAFMALAPGGRLAIISFHSMEDRIVKHSFRTYAHDQKGVLITKKPITPTPEEKQQNPRSRSAKLRIIQKL